MLNRNNIAIAATSVLPANERDSYEPGNLFDGDLTTAWNHCGSECTFDDDSSQARNGVGVQITMTFDEQVQLVGLRIANGYQKSDEIFESNNRVQILAVDHAGPLETITLDDTPGYQDISLQPVMTDFLILEVRAVYVGDQTFNDVAISELEVLVAETN